MDCVKTQFDLSRQSTIRFYRNLAPSRPDPMPDPLDAISNSLLSRLPREILQQVASHLPLSSAVSFSLSCRHIALVIGTQYIDNLRNSHHDKLKFLKLLERYFPDQIVCDSCGKFHKIQNAEKYSFNSSFWLSPEARPLCTNEDLKNGMEHYMHWKLGTTIFKMVMKHHRYFGHDVRTQQLLKLLSASAYMGIDDLTTKNKGECLIKNGSLFTRKCITFRGQFPPSRRHLLLSYICPHLHLRAKGQRLRINTTSILIYPILPENKWSKSFLCEKVGSWRKGSRPSQCQYCRTEYTVEVKHDERCPIEVKTVIWKDFGQGPGGEGWEAHQIRRDAQGHRLQPAQKTIKFPIGEIKSVFQPDGTELKPSLSASRGARF
ncbi:hypothetical protein OCU04_008278 [Sclerotinia nivalis]|uniref:F-box domain-containing protein n=1 Tax=Sclerotinia nivalis TaxID=352851 RepID=A0A9X0DHH2_9HELO|nr:hypothetical protein OCU04_008278 [Sclerotinia nivalis]